MRARLSLGGAVGAAPRGWDLRAGLSGSRLLSEIQRLSIRHVSYRECSAVEVSDSGLEFYQFCKHGFCKHGDRRWFAGLFYEKGA